MKKATWYQYDFLFIHNDVKIICNISKFFSLLFYCTFIYVISYLSKAINILAVSVAKWVLDSLQTLMMSCKQ